MPNLTTEEKRALAGLKTSQGFKLLLEKVVKLNREQELDKLKIAVGGEEIVDAACRFRAWDDVVRLLEQTPEHALEELKAEGDPIYG